MISTCQTPISGASVRSGRSTTHRLSVFHQANWFLMNVQFYFYPFVFVTFFKMAAVTRWVGSKLALRRQTTAVQEGV